MEFLDNLFLNQKKDKIVANLQGVVSAGRNYNEYTRDSLIYEKEFIKSINELVAQEVPEFTDEIKKITDLYSRAIGQESYYIRGKSRSIEDLNDIQERFVVVVRANERYRDAKHDLRQTNQNLKDAEARYEQEQSKGGSKTAKYSVQIQECKIAKKAAIENLKKATQNFIDEKKKFNAFRTRRMKQSYHCYGKSTKDSMEHVAQSYQMMKDAVSEAQIKVDQILRMPQPLPEQQNEPVQEEPLLETGEQEPALAEVPVIPSDPQETE